MKKQELTEENIRQRAIINDLRKKDEQLRVEFSGVLDCFKPSSFFHRVSEQDPATWFEIFFEIGVLKEAARDKDQAICCEENEEELLPKIPCND